MKRLEDREWWPELVALKDVFSLRELAERFGAAPAAIANALRRNKLDRAPAPSGPRVHRSPTWQKAAADAAVRPPPALPAPAEEVAEVVVAPVAAPVAAPVVAAPPSAEDLRGYRVVIDQSTYIIVAPDVARAATVAARSARGEVYSLELLGRALSA
jgi:hypothetical protein